MQRPDRGHAVRPHTADTRIEAWGPTAGACLEEAVAALVSTGLDVAGVEPTATRTVSAGPASLTEQLVGVLEEVLTLLDADGVVVCSARVGRLDEHGLDATLAVAPLAAVTVVGAGPKGISRDGLRFAATRAGWRCEAVVDV